MSKTLILEWGWNKKLTVAEGCKSLNCTKCIFLHVCSNLLYPDLSFNLFIYSVIIAPTGPIEKYLDSTVLGAGLKPSENKVSFL